MKLNPDNLVFETGKALRHLREAMSILSDETGATKEVVKLWNQLFKAYCLLDDASTQAHIVIAAIEVEDEDLKE